MSGITLSGTVVRDTRLLPSASAVGVRLLDRGVFGALLFLVPLAAIPYGAVEPWWEAIIECSAFILCGCWLVRCHLTGKWPLAGIGLLLPILALAGFALIQSLHLAVRIPGTVPGLAISADPFETRRFFIWIVAIALTGWLLLCHLTSEKRLRALVYVIIGVGLASALFGLARQSLQHVPDAFVLPRLLPGRGYAQFINRNHFAFLAEMSLGLTLGLAFDFRANRNRAAIHVMIALTLWGALVLSNSRGALVANAAQLLFGLLLCAVMFRDRFLPRTHSRALRKVLAPVLVLVLAISLLGLLAIGTAWLGGDAVALRIATLPDEASVESVDGRRGVRRSEILAATWRLFEERPLFGAGFGGYWVAVTKHHFATGESTLRQAHNDYAELLASGGVAGAAIFAWFIISFVRRAVSGVMKTSGFRRAACAGSLVGIFGVAVHSLFDFGLHVTANALVVAALIAIVACAAHQPTATNKPGIPALKASDLPE
jgi:O-antigen ligase